MRASTTRCPARPCGSARGVNGGPKRPDVTGRRRRVRRRERASTWVTTSMRPTRHDPTIAIMTDSRPKRDATEPTARPPPRKWSSQHIAKRKSWEGRWPESSPTGGRAGW
jgi:hypothetical protein